MMKINVKKLFLNKRKFLLKHEKKRLQVFSLLKLPVSPFSLGVRETPLEF